MNFKNWMEIQTLGGGIEPPKQDPVKANIVNGKLLGAFSDYSGPNSDQRPPVNSKKRNLKMGDRRP